MKFNNRLNKLESKRQIEHSSIIRLIKMGTFYDDLTDEQKDQYCLYRGIDRDVHEEMCQLINEECGVPYFVTRPLHFLLEPKPKPLTSKELQERVKEIEDYFLHAETISKDERNRELQKECEELDVLVAERRKAIAEGKSISEYPLPWEKKQNDS